MSRVGRRAREMGTAGRKLGGPGRVKDYSRQPSKKPVYNVPSGLNKDTLDGGIILE